MGLGLRVAGKRSLPDYLHNGDRSLPRLSTALLFPSSSVPSTPHPLPPAPHPADPPPFGDSGVGLPASDSPAPALDSPEHLGEGSPGLGRRGKTPGALPSANKESQLPAGWAVRRRSRRSLRAASTQSE